MDRIGNGSAGLFYPGAAVWSQAGALSARWRYRFLSGCEMVLGVPALISWHTLAARAGVPTPAVQAIARRPWTRNGTRCLAIHRAGEQRCLLRRGTCRFGPVRVR